MALDNARKENYILGNCLEGTYLEGGFGFAFRYALEDPEIDVDAKYLLLFISTFFNKTTGDTECFESRDRILKTLNFKTKEFYGARESLENNDYIKVTSRRKTYRIPGRTINESTLITLNQRPKKLVDSNPSATLLSENYGLFPRKLLEDSALRRIDKVTAAYLYSLLGSNLSEITLHGNFLRSVIRTSGKDSTLEEMTQYRMEAVFKRLKEYFSIKLIKGCYDIYKVSHAFKEEKEPQIPQDSIERNNYSATNKGDSKNVPEENVPQEKVPLVKVPEENVSEENVPPIITKDKRTTTNQNKNDKSKQSIYPQSGDKIEDPGDKNSAMIPEALFQELQNKENKVLADNLIRAILLLSKTKKDFTEQISAAQEEAVMPEIIRLTIDAYEEFGKKNPIRIPHAYLATTFWEKLTNRAMYLSGEASEKLKEQYFKWYRIYLAYTDNMLAKSEILPPEVMQAFKVIGSRALRGCNDPERYYEEFRKEYMAAIEGK